MGPNYGNAGERGAPVEAGALDGKAGLQEGVQAEKDAAEELRARNDITDASRSQQALKKRISNSLKQIDRIDQAGNDDAYIPWAMGFVQNAASMTASQRMFGFGDDKKGEKTWQRLLKPIPIISTPPVNRVQLASKLIAIVAHYEM